MCWATKLGVADISTIVKSSYRHGLENPKYYTKLFIGAFHVDKVISILIWIISEPWLYNQNKKVLIYIYIDR